MMDEGTIESQARDSEKRLLAKIATLETIIHSERKRNEALLLKSQEAEDKCLDAQIKLENAVDKLEDFELKTSKFEQLEDLYHDLKIAYARLKDENEKFVSETELVLEDRNEEIERLGSRLEEVPVADSGTATELRHPERKQPERRAAGEVHLAGASRGRRRADGVSEPVCLRVEAADERDRDRVRSHFSSNRRRMKRDMKEIHNKVRGFGGVADQLAGQNAQLKVKVDEFERKELYNLHYRESLGSKRLDLRSLSQWNSVGSRPMH